MHRMLHLSYLLLIPSPCFGLLGVFGDHSLSEVRCLSQRTLHRVNALVLQDFGQSQLPSHFNEFGFPSFAQ